MSNAVTLIPSNIAGKYFRIHSAQVNGKPAQSFTEEDLEDVDLFGANMVKSLDKKDRFEKYAGKELTDITFHKVDNKKYYAELVLPEKLYDYIRSFYKKFPPMPLLTETLPTIPRVTRNIEAILTPPGEFY